MFRPLFLSILILSIAAKVSAETCYNTTGGADSSLIPCNGDGGCCRIGDICYSSGLCKGSKDPTSNINYYYDGCTSADWTAPGCAPQCLSKTSIDANGLQPCAGGTDGYNNYCCLGFDATCDCSNESVLVSIPAGTVVTIIASSTSSSSSPTSASMNTSSGTVSASVSPPAASSATAPDSSAAPQQNNQQHSGLSGGAIAGIAVGAACGVLVCIAAVWFLSRCQRSLGDDNNVRDTLKQPPLDEQRLYQPGNYVKAELDSTGSRVPDRSFEDKDGYTHKMSELPFQNHQAPVEVPA